MTEIGRAVLLVVGIILTIAGVFLLIDVGMRQAQCAWGCNFAFGWLLFGMIFAVGLALSLLAVYRMGKATTKSAIPQARAL